MHYGNSGIENVLPYLLEVDLIANWIPQFKKVTQTYRVDSTRRFLDAQCDMPFPLSVRQSSVYVQAFNNLEVNGTLTYILTSIDTGSGEDRKVPQHIREIATQFLKENGNQNKNKKTVNMDIKLLCGEFKFHDKSTFTLSEYSSINVNSFSLPKTFNKMFIKSFVLGKFNTMQ